jgi:hypothetical protein
MRRMNEKYKKKNRLVKNIKTLLLLLLLQLQLLLSGFQELI